MRDSVTEPMQRIIAPLVTYGKYTIFEAQKNNHFISTADQGYGSYPW